MVELWNSLRDAAGKAILDYHSMVPTGRKFNVADCHARASICIRVQAQDPEGSIEIFMKADTVYAATLPNQPSPVCKVRLGKDRQGEFYNDDRVLEADEVCRLALENFMFPASASR